MNPRRTQDRRAVTLTELLVVLAIISLLATIAVPVYVQKTEQARIAIARQEVKEIAHAQDQVFAIHGYYVPIHVLDNLPTLASGAPGSTEPRDDFANYLANGSGRAMDPLANPAESGGNSNLGPNPPLTSTAVGDNPRLAKLVLEWTGPYLQAQRLDYGDKTRDRFNTQTNSLNANEIARAMVLDPWGRPYRMYSPLGIVGSVDEPSASNPFQRTGGTNQYNIGNDDGLLRTTADTSRRFDRWAIMSFGRDGISDRSKTGAANESVRDDIYYVFGLVPGESFYRAF